MKAEICFDCYRRMEKEKKLGIIQTEFFGFVIMWQEKIQQIGVINGKLTPIILS